eukprot:TRINITY_DN57948_c0_g1_i1.p1 TRINITY_DN57948_c0_g1~~TRINITY_DN57948_c0_g1_i1.p1  ORF type:complete len:431 (+),score=64.70 TRINITY_DN57948_c0_g1_i1:27-1319(+)
MPQSSQAARDQRIVGSGVAGVAASPQLCLFGSAEHVDVHAIPSSAVRRIDLVEKDDLVKFVWKEGDGNAPPMHSRVMVHHGTYSNSGVQMSTSRDGRRCEPCAFQLGGGKVIEAWQRAVKTMTRGEMCWVRSSPSFAFGEFGCPPRIPANATLWFALELVDYKLPGTVNVLKEAGAALQEAERHLELGRASVKRQAFGQARQAFRRAVDSVPEKLLLGSSSEMISKFAALERSCLLNQALCSQKLASEDEDHTTKHWEDVVRVCTRLLERHLDAASKPEGKSVQSHPVGDEDSNTASPTSMPELAAAIRAASSKESPAAWAVKALYRRATAREHLSSISDAVLDLVAAQKYAPEDVDVARLLTTLRERQRRIDLKPAKMYAGILERERDERESEAALKTLEEKRRRREARLRLERQSEESAKLANEAEPK